MSETTTPAKPAVDMPEYAERYKIMKSYLSLCKSKRAGGEKTRVWMYEVKQQLKDDGITLGAYFAAGDGSDANIKRRLKLCFNATLKDIRLTYAKDNKGATEEQAKAAVDKPINAVALKIDIAPDIGSTAADAVGGLI